MRLLQAVETLEDVKMQSQDTQKTNVISLFDSKKKAEAAAPEQQKTEGEGSTEGLTFDEVMKQNAKNKERMERERANANKSVLRSYRIKH